MSDAKAHQAQVKKDIAEQKAEIQKLNDLQAGLNNEIQQTSAELKGIGADLDAVKVQISKMQTKINGVKTQYNNLVRKLAGLDATLAVVEAEEVAKRQELGWRKDLLAQRIRDAYDTDRTSLLETLVGRDVHGPALRDELLHRRRDPGQGPRRADRQRPGNARRDAPDDARTRSSGRTSCARRPRPRSAPWTRACSTLKVAKAQLKTLETATAKALASQKAAYAAIQRNKAAARKALAKAARAQRTLQNQINELIRKNAQSNGGRIPSQFNGTLEWPMNGR